MSLLFFKTIWVAVSINSFQLCNIEPEPVKLETVCFLKLNNTLKYFESNHILFSVLKDFLKTISGKVPFLVKYQSGFQPAKLRIARLRQICSMRMNIYIYIFSYIKFRYKYPTYSKSQVILSLQVGIIFRLPYISYIYLSTYNIYNVVTHRICRIFVSNFNI